MMKTTTKRLAKTAIAFATATILAASGLIFSGCSCSAQREVNMDPDEAQRYTLEEIGGEQVQVVDSGFTVKEALINEDMTSQTVSTSVDFAFIVENHNSGYAAQNVPFTVIGYAEDGTVMFTSGANCQYIYPGIQTAVSGTATMVVESGRSLEVAELSVEPSANVIDWMAIGMSDAEVASLLQVSNESAERAGDDVASEGSSDSDTASVVNTVQPGDVTVKATVTGNIYDGDKIFSTTILENTLEGHVVTIFRDSNGRIVYGSGASNIILDEASEQMAQLEGSNENYNVTLTDVPEYASFEIYAMPGL